MDIEELRDWLTLDDFDRRGINRRLKQYAIHDEAGCGNRQELAMKVRIQVVIEAENGEPEKVEEIARLERGALRPEELGLTLAEAKVLLHGMQQAVVTEQIVEYPRNSRLAQTAERTGPGKGDIPSFIGPCSGNSTSSAPSLRLPLPKPRPP